MSNDNDVVGTIVLYVDGQEFDCISFSPKIEAGRKPVPTMNKTGRVRKTTKTIKSISLSVEVVIPETGDIDWGSVDDALLVIESLDGTKRTSYQDCGVTSYSESYKLDGEAVRSLEMYALDMVEE